ncbi:uncharacterized protein BXZ73DRAFT_78757 [Epithele typhae]|uniref:uncharacterized protein n=1 Tax=Epithele typhae TaxID=378194 RepID=UPI002007AC84|nr:uncharacterized protein BXZ73DRAFT_78757 [Epithele typhae]KAH9926251.1 hypothetical protein BXZ73DRAFT_78757 [Epithele typhae]
MLFTTSFAALVVTTLAVLASKGSATPTTSARMVTDSEFLTWLATTDANITYVGPATSKRAKSVTVTYCTKRSGNVCGGSCQVYSGPDTCLDASGTSCLMASADVSFCDHGGCSGSCNQLSSCGTKLSGGFCDTPGTNSIIVPFVN